MLNSLNIKIIQANFTVGAIDNNLKKIISTYIETTQTINCPDLIVFSELSITGYPAEDLYLQKNFQDKALKAIEELKSITKNKDCSILVGNIYVNDRKEIINAAYLISNGEVIQVIGKNRLANYGIFDEERYFKSEQVNQIFSFKGYKIGLLICEDMWFLENSDALSKQGADIIITLNASPFYIDKDEQRKQLAKNICTKYQLDLLYVNQVCGQDEIIFDGGSFVCNKQGDIKVQLSYFKEDQALINWNKGNMIVNNKVNTTIPSQIESIYQALMLGLVDYVYKNGFDKVVLGLSGGIDSALTASIAVDALGSDKVLAVMLPSKYTSKLSMIDAETCAKNLNIELLTIPIEGVVESIKTNFKELSNLANQNIQARTRGLLLMTISNQFGHLLLSTGNKSENSVGYATLYGDMCGGYNLLKDVYKHQVYQLVQWRNSINLVIPESIINKAPSAELEPNQKDQDTLPDYELLDQILFLLIEKNLSITDIVNKGYNLEIVKEVFNMLKRSEYKRKQSCLGPIISSCSLSKDRRYPITNHFENI